MASLSCCMIYQKLWRTWDFPSLQANSFMNAGKRHRMPRSETKGFVTAIAVACISAFSCTSSPNHTLCRIMQRGPGDPCTWRLVLYKRTPKAREPRSFKWAVNLQPFALEGDTISSKTVHHTNILEKLVRNKGNVCFLPIVAVTTTNLVV